MSSNLAGIAGHLAPLGKAVITLALGLGATGCATSTRTGPFQHLTAARHVAPEALPLQRTVPIRMVALTSCEQCRGRSCERSCNHVPPNEYLADAVSAANETFAASGVSFQLASVERADAPDWWKHGPAPTPKTWRAIQPEAQRIFPWMPMNAWHDPEETKPADQWLEVLVAAYGRPHEITVFVQAGHTRAGTHFPNGGRGIWASDGTFGTGPESASRYLFAHELGHYFGLRHTFAHNGTNPITGKPWRLSDRWDLVYRPGSSPEDPHEYFNSREEAERYSDGDLRLIERMNEGQTNCTEIPGGAGAIECVVPGKNGYSETLRSGDPRLKGLSMPLSPQESRRFRWARNALAYGSMVIPRRLSASQIELIHIFLQYPLNVGEVATNRWGRLPDGMDVVPSYRTTLGLAQPGAPQPQPMVTPQQPGYPQYPGVQPVMLPPGSPQPNLQPAVQPPSGPSDMTGPQRRPRR